MPRNYNHGAAEAENFFSSEKLKTRVTVIRRQFHTLHASSSTIVPANSLGLKLGFVKDSSNPDQFHKNFAAIEL